MSESPPPLRSPEPRIPERFFNDLVNASYYVIANYQPELPEDLVTLVFCIIDLFTYQLDPDGYYGDVERSNPYEEHVYRMLVNLINALTAVGAHPTVSLPSTDPVPFPGFRAAS